MPSPPPRPPKVYVFNVGDANFTATFEDQEMVIQDAGKYGLQQAFDFEDFKSKINKYDTNRVRTVITHQHADHMNLLPDVFLAIREINEERAEKKRRAGAGEQIEGYCEPIAIGKFYIGGNRRGGAGADPHLKEISRILGDAIKAEYIGNKDPTQGDSQIVHRRFKYDRGENAVSNDKIQLEGGRTRQKREEKDVKFMLGVRGNRPKKSDSAFLDPSFHGVFFNSSFSIVTPTSFQPEEWKVSKKKHEESLKNANDINLVGVFRAPRAGNILFCGDATTNLLKRIQEREGVLRRPMIPSEISAMTIPHHMSKTGKQAEEWVGEIESRRRKLLFPIGPLIAIGSTRRPDGKLPKSLVRDRPDSLVLKTSSLEDEGKFSIKLGTNGIRVLASSPRYDEGELFPLVPYSWKFNSLARVKKALGFPEDQKDAGILDNCEEQFKEWRTMYQGDAKFNKFVKGVRKSASRHYYPATYARLSQIPSTSYDSGVERLFKVRTPRKPY